MTDGTGESSALAPPPAPRKPGAGKWISLSPLQQQLWSFDRLSQKSAAHNICRAYRLTGPLDLRALGRAVSRVVERHESLQARFPGGEDGVRPVIEPAAGSPVCCGDVSQLPRAERETAAARLLAEAVREPFDLAAGRLLRLLAVRLGTDGHLVAIVAHQICVDARSLAAIAGEISASYAAGQQGRLPELPEPVQFPDVAAWQLGQAQQERSGRDLEYWARQLRDLEPLALPAGRPRPGTPSYRSRVVTRALPAGARGSLRDLAGTRDTTMLALAATALTAVLTRYTGQDEIVIGTPADGRDAPGLDSVVGPLANLLALRADLSGDPEFTEALGRVSQTAREAMAHRSAPFAQVVERLGVPGDVSRSPVFQVVLRMLDDTGEPALRLPGVTAEPVLLAEGSQPYDLTISVAERADELELRAEVSSDVLEAAAAGRLLGHLERVLMAVAADPALRVSQLPLVSGRERELLAEDWQGVLAAEPAEPVHAQVALVAAAHPDLVAARLGAAELTYGELVRRARLVAAWLRGAGTGPGDVVAVVLERGPDLLVALLGVLSAGAAFAVLDPAHPERRLELVLGDTAAKVVIGSEPVMAGLPGTGWTPLCLEREWPRLEAQELPAQWQELADAGSLAYVLYTSGSTGQPKGVLVEHHALTTFTAWLSGLFGLGPGARMLHHLALVFDFAIGEVFTGLVSGATLVFVPERDRSSPEAIGELLASERIVYLGGTPTMLAAIPRRPDPEYPDLKYMVAGGEAFPGELPNRWNTAPGRRFINAYGPTEAAVGCTFYEVDRRPWTSTPPIGRAMPNRYAYVLDPHDNLCPIGVPGEIAVGGRGLARGYQNLPELTSQRFSPDPVHPGGRIYRTGDLGTWTEDGQIRFLGRRDDQVKVNGLRIELGEIESALAAHPDVAAAAAAVVGTAGCGQRLIGYVVPGDGPPPGGAALTGFLADRLPRYMIPTQYQILDSLPLTSVGKIDRPRLPAPAPAAAAQESPRTPTETQVAAIFTAILGCDSVSRDDSFFALGGTSLQAARAVLEIRDRTGAEISPGAFYGTPLVADIAAAVDQVLARDSSEWR